MKSKLILKLDTDAITRAKHYISIHRGFSLSKLVENYYNSLTKSEEGKQVIIVPPIVSGLAGIAKKGKIKNVKEDYTDYLIEKYR